MDADDCARLNEAYGEKGFRYFPYVLGERAESRTFYVANWPPSCGLYKKRVDFWSRYTPVNLRKLTVVREVPVTTVALDNCLKDEGIAAPDFIKVDVEGAELEVLRGGRNALAKALGVLVEARFSNANGCPLFAETDIFMRENRFRLYDFTYIGKYPRKHMPDPRAWLNGEEVSWPEDYGQLIWADALYFADPIEYPETILQAGLDDPVKLIKFISLLELFGCVDYAAELVTAFPAVISKVLPASEALDLLTPTVKGRKVSYDQYVRAAKNGTEAMINELAPADPPPPPPPPEPRITIEQPGSFFAKARAAFTRVFK